MNRNSALEAMARSVFPPAGLQIHLHADYGSSNPSYRNLIRTHLALLEENASADILDLNKIPTLSHHSVSISHCASLGGFAVVNQPKQIGFDIEVFDRVSDAVAQRISTPEECRAAPNSAALWVAKEATFKSLRSKHQPPVIADILIYDWAPLADGQSQSFRAKCRNSDPILDGRGAVYNIDRHIFGIFLF